MPVLFDVSRAQPALESQQDCVRARTSPARDIGEQDLLVAALSEQDDFITDPRIRETRQVERNVLERNADDRYATTSQQRVRRGRRIDGQVAVGQTDGQNSDARAVPGRTDVDESFMPPERIPRPDVEYFDSNDWDYTLNLKRKIQRRLRELISSR